MDEEPAVAAGVTARDLNPEAGDHAVPEDPRELAAALRAGERTWERFPYYEKRYGERGRRFTQSDSAWLATLYDLPRGRAERQVLWLGGVLAARGMPRWLLEVHLEHLAEEMEGTGSPEGPRHGARLRELSGLLAQERRGAGGMPDARLEALSAEFEASVASVPEGSRLPGAGALLAAAAADERAGVMPHVADAVAAWLLDASRFPDPAWAEAVRETLRRAREQGAG